MAWHKSDTIYFGAALWALAYTGKWREFGIVVVAGTAANVADCAAIWKLGGWER
jgi:hypothetical protein